MAHRYYRFRLPPAASPPDVGARGADTTAFPADAGGIIFRSAMPHKLEAMKYKHSPLGDL